MNLGGRAYAIGDAVWRAILLTLLWWAGTLAGAVALGFGPSTLAAHEVARRHERGEAVRTVPAFARAYRTELARGNALYLPAAVVAVLLWRGHATLAASELPAAGAASVACLTALGVLGAAALYVPSMAVHYRVPTTRLWATAAAFALTHLPGTLVLAGTGAVLAAASAAAPGLLPTVVVGAWVLLGTHLCLRAYAQNDDTVAARARATRATPSARHHARAVPTT